MSGWVYDEYGNFTGQADYTIDELFDHQLDARHVRDDIRLHRKQHGQDPTLKQVEEYVREEYVEEPCETCIEWLGNGCDVPDCRREPRPLLSEPLVQRFAKRFCAEAGIAVE